MKSKAHTRYKSNGIYIPGTTTITGLENKPFLIKWANNLGLEGIDSTKYVDDLANVGTCAHYMIESELKKTEPDLSEFTQTEIDRAKVCLVKWHKWLSENDFEFIASELQLISDRYKFGGTVDLYCKLNGKFTLIDIKTSKSCYPEHKTQVSAYEVLLKESLREVEEVKILRIGREEGEGFDEIEVGNRQLRFDKFLKLLDVYYLNKKLKEAS